MMEGSASAGLLGLAVGSARGRTPLLSFPPRAISTAMKRFLLSILRYSVLVAVTALSAVALLLWAGQRNRGDADAGQADASPLPTIAQPKAPVAVMPIAPQWCELTSRFTGKIRPWETYTLAFEVGGRVVALGEDERGVTLDDGHRVRAGQMLARVDERVFLARQSETAAQLEEAVSNLNRARQNRERSPDSMSDTEFQQFITAAALAKAQHVVALKNLDDAILKSPVDAVISRRLVNAGESVTPGQAAFELVQTRDVLLVVDVPESQIRELELRSRAIAARRQRTGGASGTQVTGTAGDDDVFRAYVALAGRDRFGRPWPPIDGEVRRIAEVADPRTGLFEVEVRMPNKDGLLRPGMVATARIVTDQILGYCIPETAVLFREGKVYLFTTDERPAAVQTLFWKIASGSVIRARRVDVGQWIDQGPSIIVPAGAVELQSVVLRGQQRLADGQLVRVVGEDGSAVASGRRGSTARLPDGETD